MDYQEPNLSSCLKQHKNPDKSHEPTVFMTSDSWQKRTVNPKYGKLKGDKFYAISACCLKREFPSHSRGRQTKMEPSRIKRLQEHANLCSCSLEVLSAWFNALLLPFLKS